MNQARIDAIMHPARFRILQALMGESLTTQELDDRIPDVPKSSIYRHLRILLDTDLIAVDGTRLVKGIQEKSYRLEQPPRLSQEDLEGLTAAEHLRYFTFYAITLLGGFGEYVNTATDGASIDLRADRAGYTEAAFWATNAELDAFGATLNAALLELIKNQPGHGRHKHKIAVVSHPVPGNGTSSEGESA